MCCSSFCLAHSSLPFQVLLLYSLQLSSSIFLLIVPALLSSSSLRYCCLTFFILVSLHSLFFSFFEACAKTKTKKFVCVLLSEIRRNVASGGLKISKSEPKHPKTS